MQDRSWRSVVLALLLGRGGCLERDVLSVLLWVKPSTVRRMAWSLRRRGLAAVEGERICLTRRGAEEASWIEFIARKRNKYAVLGRGVILYVAFRDRGALVYTVGLREACRVLKALEEGMTRPREVAAATGLASKTASYVSKALDVLGCPGVGCPLVCEKDK